MERVCPEYHDWDWDYDHVVDILTTNCHLVMLLP